MSSLLIYIIYIKNQVKKSRVKQLALILKESYVFESDSVRSEKAGGTQLIDHKMKAMKKLNDKFDVFAAHLENFISDTLKKCDHTTLQGKYNNTESFKGFRLNLNRFYLKVRKMRT